MNKSRRQQGAFALVGAVDEINRHARLIGAPEVFDRSSLPVFVGTDSELGFIRCVSWLYGLYQEVGRIGVSFIVRQIEGAGSGVGTRPKKHIRQVNVLRTYLQHNIDLTSERSREMEQQCGAWFASACGSSLPSSRIDWTKCQRAILEEALNVLSELKEWLRNLDGDERKSDVIQGWKNELDRSHPPYQFDQLAEKVKNDLGQPYLDHVALRKRHYSKWTSILAYRQLPYDFELEARPLIEKSVLEDSGGALPVTGKDVIEQLGVPPGPVIKQILLRAARMYENQPRDRERMLADMLNDEEITAYIGRGSSG
jgi:hypothetical protein